MKKILISTGGSGGHVFPAIAFFQHLKNDFEIKFVTDIRGSKFLEKNDINYKIINVVNIFFKIYLLPINIFKFSFSIFQSLIFIKKNNFNYIVSTGGYMSFPICIAAKILNIKIILFEPNMIIGRANKFIIKFAENILCYSEQVNGISKQNQKKIIVIPPLLRKEVYEVKNQNQNQLSSPIKIIIIGGSQGASFFDSNINQIVLNLSKNFNLEISQQVSDESKVLILKKFYNDNKIKNNVYKFDKKLLQNLKYYDLAISRSGSSVINELCQIGIPFIAVPFPNATDNHQYLNAKYYEDLGACWICQQSEFNNDKITNLLNTIFQNQTEYFKKKQILDKISYQNTWNNINQKLTKIFNEN